jgi:acetyltransferase-like isoleucine patch superfamily enzyme
MSYKFFWLIRAFIYKFFFKKIGSLTYIGKPVFLYGISRVELGRRVRIFPGARIETHGLGKIKIDDNVGIGQNFHIIAGGDLSIGKGTVISAEVFVNDLDNAYEEIGKNVLEQDFLVSTTSIGENCFIGIGAKIMAGTTLGRQCIVGANSVVKGQYPDYCVIAGAPAKIVKRYNFESSIWQKTNKSGSFVE